MTFLTLEEAKRSFEIGTVGNFLVKFEPNTFTKPELKNLVTKMNLVGGNNKYLPADSVSYPKISMEYYGIQLGGNTVEMPSQVKLPDSVSIELLEDNLESINKAMYEWYKITPQYRYGRATRNPLEYALMMRIYYFDKPSSGKGINVVSKETLMVTVPDDIQKSGTQGMSVKKTSLTMKIVGYVD